MNEIQSALTLYYIEQIVPMLRQKHYEAPIMFSTRMDHYVLTLFNGGVTKTFTFDDGANFLSVEYFKRTDSFSPASLTELLAIINACVEAS